MESEQTKPKFTVKREKAEELLRETAKDCPAIALALDLEPQVGAADADVLYKLLACSMHSTMLEMSQEIDSLRGLLKEIMMKVIQDAVGKSMDAVDAAVAADAVLAAAESKVAKDA